MNKSKLIIIVAAVCVCCSIVSFFIGYNVPHDSSEQAPAPKKQGEDSKYVGIWLASYYENGNQKTATLYLNDNNDCNNPSNTNKYYKCTWEIKGKTLTTTIQSDGGSLGRTKEDCENRLKELIESTKDDSWKIVIYDEEYAAQHHSGMACIVTRPSTIVYDILDDGGLLKRASEYSSGNLVYYKRG